MSWRDWEADFALWRHLPPDAGDAHPLDMRGVSPDQFTDDELAHAALESHRLVRDIWGSLPPAMRRYITVYQELLHRCGTAILVDYGTKPGGSYAPDGLGQHLRDQPCPRDVEAWVRQCQEYYAALVVLIGPGDFAPTCDPVPRTCSVLAFADLEYDDLDRLPKPESWRLRVPVMESLDPDFTHDLLVLTEDEVAETLNRVTKHGESGHSR